MGVDIRVPVKVGISQVVGIMGTGGGGGDGGTGGIGGGLLSKKSNRSR